MNARIRSLSHVGLRRKTNEDRLLCATQRNGSLLFAVADGMGGAPGGARAASMVAGAYRKSSRLEPVSRASLSAIALRAQEKILEYGKLHPAMSGMGTTLTAALLEEDVLYWAHIGDSRLYLLHAGRLHRLTTDHRFLESMIRDGDMTEEEARRHPLNTLLEQCLGCPEVRLECGFVAVGPGDCVLACTDGLHDQVRDAAIEGILNTETLPVREKAAGLVQAALAAGGRDNITLVLVQLPPG